MVDDAREPGIGRATLERWLAELGLQPVERAVRDGVASWDLVLDGRRRADLRITLILDPAFALICWAQFAPPISDAYRRSYRQLLRWNDELPFAKFGLGEDDRPILSVELPADRLDRDALGRALARILAIADRLLEPSRAWLEAAGWGVSIGARPSRGARLIERYAGDLGELADDLAERGEDPAEPAVVGTEAPATDRAGSAGAAIA